MEAVRVLELDQAQPRMIIRHGHVRVHRGFNQAAKEGRFLLAVYLRTLQTSFEFFGT